MENLVSAVLFLFKPFVPSSPPRGYLLFINGTLRKLKRTKKNYFQESVRVLIRGSFLSHRLRWPSSCLSGWCACQGLSLLQHLHQGRLHAATAPEVHSFGPQHQPSVQTAPDKVGSSCQPALWRNSSPAAHRTDLPSFAAGTDTNIWWMHRKCSFTPQGSGDLSVASEQALQEPQQQPWAHLSLPGTWHTASRVSALDRLGNNSSVHFKVCLKTERR